MSVGLLFVGAVLFFFGLTFGAAGGILGALLMSTAVLISALESQRRLGPLCRFCETGPMVPLDTPAAHLMGAWKTTNPAPKPAPKPAPSGSFL
jgi:hypothetical protein